MNSQNLPNFVFDFEELISDEELAEQMNIIEAIEAENNANQSRFAVLEEDELNNLVASAEAKGTKKNTRWVIKTVEDWCRERDIQKPLLEMAKPELNEMLRRFYAEARNRNGEEYSRSSLLGFRNAIDRHFAVHNIHLKITHNPIFQSSNKMLECKLKVNRRQGKENVQHKAVIEPADVLKMQKSSFLSHENSVGLLHRVWFIVTLYWCRRGVKGQRQLSRDSFAFGQDADGREFASMTHEETSKNHQGGICDKASHEKQTRLYSTNQLGDSFWCLKKYISKLNPKQPAFFQRPKPEFLPGEDVWYENKPLGVNKLSTMMKSISAGAGLSKVYTNHCVRATAITMWSDADIPARHIMNISGHANEQSIASYNRRPSAGQLEKCSDVLSTALTSGTAEEVNRTPLVPATTSASPSVHFDSRSLAINSLPNSIFSGCSIGTTNVFVFPK